jgi:hypothetical protein
VKSKYFYSDVESILFSLRLNTANLACHELKVELYYVARSGVDMIETGWTRSVEKRILI